MLQQLCEKIGSNTRGNIPAKSKCIGIAAKIATGLFKAAGDQVVVVVELDQR